MASLANPSMMLLRSTRPSLSACSSLAASCSYTFSTSAALEQRSKKNSQRKRSPPKGPKNTPPGTNKKPDPPGRPKRYDTTYGIPPLHPAMYRKGANKLNREAEEKAQRPDFETLWRLQEEASASTSKNEIAEKRKQIAELRANQPRRHPLWAFFREVTKRDIEDMQHFKPVEKGPDGEEKPYPGYYALGSSVLRPNKDLDTSGMFSSSSAGWPTPDQPLIRLTYSLCIKCPRWNRPRMGSRRA